MTRLATFAALLVIAPLALSPPGAAAQQRPAPAMTPAVSAAEIRQAVRDVLTSDRTLLRATVTELLRDDPALRALFSAPAPAPQAPVPPTASMPTPSSSMPSGTALAPPERAHIEAVVRNYLLTNPELLQEVMGELEKKQTAAEAEKRSKALTEQANVLFSSPRQVVIGNPHGDVTMVEFFDYNCGFCKRAMTDMFEMMKTDTKLRVVLKEFPVLGEGSVEAAQVAVAVRMQDKTGKKYLDFHQKLLGGRGEANRARALAVAKEVGMDMARLEKDMAGEEPKATLQESFKLADSLGMNGTPSYVVGSEVVIGAVGLDALRQKVNTARCGKAAC